MQPSHSSEPRVPRCPNCGAPLDARPDARTTLCGYCGQSIELAEPSSPRPTHPHAKAPPASVPARRAPILIQLFFAAASACVAAYFAFANAHPSQEPVAAVSSVEPGAPAAGNPVLVRYLMGSLLGITPTVDIDESRAHLLGLFPTIHSSRISDELRYVVPLSHRWFSAAELGWKNERAGKLASVAFRPPVGELKLKNQKEIADCLSKSLGKPEVREIDHLAGDLSYFWGRNFPKAWASLYSGYLWLSFEDPKGVAPVTFQQVVRALDGCAPQTHF
jgi:hypothetical protein